MNTFPNAIAPLVAALDFHLLRAKLSDPVEGEDLSGEQLDLAEREYRRFLTLHLLHPTVDLVPNRLVDLFWHAHILDTAGYQRDCARLFGYLLHHDPYLGMDGPESYRELELMFARTVGIYEAHFGPYPLEQLSAVRCKGHACHAPTPCRCRVPGACSSVSAAA